MSKGNVRARQATDNNVMRHRKIVFACRITETTIQKHTQNI